MVAADVILALAAIATALITGLMYGYSCSVNIGLGKLADAGYVAAMQSINRAIQNPVFFASFFGTLLLLPASAWLQYRAGDSGCFLLLLAATIIYFVGMFGVTIVGNVPLNRSLDKFQLESASLKEIAEQRARFESPWNRLHFIRTLSSVVCLICVIVACVNKMDTMN